MSSRRQSGTARVSRLTKPIRIDRSVPFSYGGYAASERGHSLDRSGGHGGGAKRFPKFLFERAPRLRQTTVSPLNMGPEPNCPQKVTVWTPEEASVGGEPYACYYVYILQ